MNMHQKALGPRLIQFLHKDSLCDDFLVSTLDFVNLQIKMEQLRRGKQVTMDLLRDGKLITTNEIVGAELELMIEESTRLLSEKYTLVVMEHSDYTAHLMDQNFFEHLFKFTNKLLESQFGRQVRDDNFAKRALGNVFRTRNFNKEIHHGAWKVLSEKYKRPTRPITRSQMMKEHARVKREKIQTKKELMSLGVAMRTRSPLLTVKLPSTSTKQKQFSQMTDLSRSSKLVIKSRCTVTTQACIEGICEACGSGPAHSPLSFGSHGQPGLPRAATALPSTRTSNFAPLSNASFLNTVPLAFHSALLSSCSNQDADEIGQSSLPREDEEAKNPSLSSLGTVVGSARAEKLKHIMRRLDFDTYEPKLLSSPKSFECLECICEDFHIFEVMNIDKARFRMFLTELRARHNTANPWHNWTQSVATCQMMYFMLRTADAKVYFTVRDAFCMILAAVSSGVENPGLNEPLLVKDDNELQLIRESEPATDKWQHGGNRLLTPAEKVELIYTIGTQDKCNIFATFTPRVKKQVRELAAFLINCGDLRTMLDRGDLEFGFPLLPPRVAPHLSAGTKKDFNKGRRSSLARGEMSSWDHLKKMKVHQGVANQDSEDFQIVKMLGAFSGVGEISEKKSIPAWAQGQEKLGLAVKLMSMDAEPVSLKMEEKRRLMAWMFYVAAMAYPCRSLAVAKKAAVNVREELWRQGDQEVERGWQPTAPCMMSKVEAQCDLGFVEHIVAPSVVYLAQALPLMRQALYNLSRYRARLLSTALQAVNIQQGEPPAKEVDAYARMLLQNLDERQKIAADELSKQIDVDRVKTWSDQFKNEIKEVEKRKERFNPQPWKSGRLKQPHRVAATAVPQVELNEDVQPLTVRSEREAQIIGVDPSTLLYNVGGEARGLLSSHSFLDSVSQCAVEKMPAKLATAGSRFHDGRVIE